MSFQSKGFWMSKDGGCLTDGEITTYNNNASRIEPKRPHQWFTDSGEAELFPNKKQAVESSASFGGMSASTLSPWGTMSGFNSVPGQASDHLFDAEATRNVSFDDRNIGSVNAGNLDMVNSSSFGLSIAQTLQDPKSGVNYGGFRKVKISEVRDSENIMPMSVGNSYTREDSNVMSMGHGYNKVDDRGISMGLTYGREEDHVLTVGDSYGREDDNFISVSQSFNRGDVSTMAMGHNYKADNNTIPIVSSYGKGDGNIMSMAENFNKGDNSVTSMSQTYRSCDSSISMDNTCNKGDDSTASISQSSNKVDTHMLSMSHSFDKGASNIISFGGYNDDDDANASGRLICTYDLLMGQSSVPRSDPLGQKDLVVSDANALINTAQVLAVAESASKKKEDQKSTKKTPPNNFPSNVRSLLSTGILDEVPVKYIAWSREKELRGIIKGSGYLCGCQSCNFSKVINAYEFERHAGCKTKHPNNHIYFENGKTIYGIVQELRSTPQNMLFDVIQTITGSPINQKSFRLWKESFLAATRELQRIYGKDDRNQPL